MVPGVGVAPTSLRLRRSAFTGLASQANWCGRRGSHPGLHVGNVARCSYATSAWWGMDGIEPLATQDAPRRVNWCVWSDSNGHCTASRTAPSAFGVQTRGGPSWNRTNLARVKRPPLGHSAIGPGGCRWLRSTCRRIKKPLPLHSGLRLDIRRSAERAARSVLPDGLEPPNVWV
jgi:hypothetical protein